MIIHKHLQNGDAIDTLPDWTLSGKEYKFSPRTHIVDVTQPIKAAPIVVFRVTVTAINSEIWT